MAGQTIRYDYAEISHAISSMNTFARKLETELENLRSQLGPLREDWDAEARQAYDTAQEAWNEATHKIRETIDEVSRTVQMGSNNMSGTDKRRAQAFM